MAINKNAINKKKKQTNTTNKTKQTDFIDKEDKSDIEKQTVPTNEDVVAPIKKKSKAGRKKQEVKRSKLIKIHSEVHKLIKYNNQELDIGEYVEALILLDRNDKTQWLGFKPMKLGEEDRRTFVRVLPIYHRKAKHNLRRMPLTKYIEGLVVLDQKGRIEWSKLSKLTLED